MLSSLTACNKCETRRVYRAIRKMRKYHAACQAGENTFPESGAAQFDDEPRIRPCGKSLPFNVADTGPVEGMTK